jgi:hypothetical protein
LSRTGPDAGWDISKDTKFNFDQSGNDEDLKTEDKGEDEGEDENEVEEDEGNDEDEEEEEEEEQEEERASRDRTESRTIANCCGEQIAAKGSKGTELVASPIITISSTFFISMSVARISVKPRFQTVLKMAPVKTSTKKARRRTKNELKREKSENCGKETADLAHSPTQGRSHP